MKQTTKHRQSVRQTVSRNDWINPLTSQFHTFFMLLGSKEENTSTCQRRWQQPQLRNIYLAEVPCVVVWKRPGGEEAAERRESFRHTDEQTSWDHNNKEAVSGSMWKLQRLQQQQLPPLRSAPVCSPTDSIMKADLLMDGRLSAPTVDGCDDEGGRARSPGLRSPSHLHLSAECFSTCEWLIHVPVVPGSDIVQWMIKNLDIEDQGKAQAQVDLKNQTFFGVFVKEMVGVLGGSFPSCSLRCCCSLTQG